MEHITDLTFDHDGQEYEISVSFDDAALMRDAFALEVKARRVGADDDSITVTLELDFVEQRGRILHESVLWYEFEFHELGMRGNFQDQTETIPGMRDDLAADDAADPVGAAVDAGTATMSPT